MKITDRIIMAEQKFMDENIDAAKWLILTHYGLIELEQEVAANEFEDLDYYEGLRIAITGVALDNEFELA